MTILDPAHGPSDLSVLLKRCAAGDGDAERAVFDLAYEHLKRLARGVFRAEWRLQTLEPSVLVNEAFLRMPRAGEIEWQDRRHFFAVAARAMRRTIVDYARGKAARKRPHPSQRVDLDSQSPAAFTDPETVLWIDQALDELMQIDPRRARVVEMRFFAGMTHEEIAAVQHLDERTTKRDWQVARLWLYDRMTKTR
jgi:RNA polymerase sigma-70 factor, ECF subfamily